MLLKLSQKIPNTPAGDQLAHVSPQSDDNHVSSPLLRIERLHSRCYTLYSLRSVVFMENELHNLNYSVKKPNLSGVLA
jgi:hypothetical protein